jgi:ParB-like chromosome segregation protein Spo0J
MSKIDRNPFETDRDLTEHLKAKGRRRRANQTRLAAASAEVRLQRNDILPALELVEVPLDDLRLPTRKVRSSDPAHVREVAGSIRALGFCVPLLIGKDNLVLDGAIRVEAARLLGLNRVPCVRIDHLSDIEQRTLRLAVNRLAEKGQWDLDELKIEFEELILTDAPIEITGFTLGEIDQIVLGHADGPPDRQADRHVGGRPP